MQKKFDEKSEEKRPFGKPRRILQDNIQIDFNEEYCGGEE
jgi:hypothetical protein